MTGTRTTAVARRPARLPVSLLGLGVALTLAGPAQAQEPSAGWALARCEGAALKQAPRLGAASAAVAQAAAAWRATAATRWPWLSLGGRYTYTSETQSLSLPGLGLADPATITFGDEQAYDLELRAEVPLYTGGSLGCRDRAGQAGWRARRWEGAADSLELRHAVRRTYFAALASTARAHIARLLEERVARHLRELEGAIAIGSASEENRLQALAHLRHVEQQRVAAEAVAAADRLTLGHLVGEPGHPITPAGPLEEPLLDTLALAAGDPRGHPAYQALSAHARQSEELAGAARGGYLPTLTARASVHYGRPGVDLVDNEWMGYATAGIALHWSLWEWGARAARIEQPRAAARRLREQRRAWTQAWYTAWAQAHIALTAAREQVHKAAERVTLEAQRGTHVHARYQTASASETEWLDAQDDRAAAESELADAVARLRLAEADLLRLLGR